MSALQVVFVTEGNCSNCDGIRAALKKVRHEYRHVAVKEVHPDEPLGRSLAAEYGIRMLPAVIINGHLRLVVEVAEKLIRREIEKVRPWKATVEKYLTNVFYRESYFGTTFLCHGEKA